MHLIPPSFFAALKNGLVHRTAFPTIDHARKLLLPTSTCSSDPSNHVTLKPVLLVLATQVGQRSLDIPLTTSS